MNRTHIEVVKANNGANVFGMFDGQMLKIAKETEKFIFAEAWNGKEIKVSKQTKLCCHWKNKSTSPLFNI